MSTSTTVSGAEGRGTAEAGGRRSPRRTRTHLTPSERGDLGRAARAACPPADLEDLGTGRAGRDAVAILEHQARTRVPELVPVRHGRMRASSFAFYRGNAAGMAADLGGTATTGLAVQLCGDAHLANFGLFASPERRLVFDVNDFDETHPGPWEWDVKRLATSFVLAARENDFSDKERRATVAAVVRGYGAAMESLAGMRTLERWYSSSDIAGLERALSSQDRSKQRKRLDKIARAARDRDNLRAFAKLATVVDGRIQFREQPPLLVRAASFLPDRAEEELLVEIRGLISGYRRTLAPDRRALLDQFELVDLARKVVGVGSVGTRCWIALLQGRDEQDPLFLQVKEAEASVLEPFVPASMKPRGGTQNQGARVVTGQRRMQSASDILLGWHRVAGLADGVERDFYVRQLWDMKGSASIEKMGPVSLGLYAGVCGSTLARAHARAGDAIAISAYLRGGKAFTKAMCAYGEGYADQNERDFEAFVAALESHRLDYQAGL